MSLATKYRPKTFDDVTEQTYVVNIVRKMCADKQLSNRNFLFIGSAGCGKTTLGRIIANELNEGVAEPIEIDAASNSGVDQTRTIVKEAQQYPVIGKYKVFIIDECHALSNAAWQSLLKVLEECPARTVMIFCTTNPEKIPATILSRVQTFQLSKISLSGISSRLKYVLDCEIQEGRNITYDESALNFIAKLAAGGMRDALTLLDKALTYKEEITLENLEIALNLPNYDDYFALLQAYASKNNVEVTRIVNDVYNSGVNFVKWFEGFHSFIINVVKYIFLQDIEMTLIPSHYEDKISKYGSAHSVICLKLANKLLTMNNELKSTQYLQEVALTYLCQIPKKEHQ
jgi:DNA polymerase-3 subunit gamma/tau